METERRKRAELEARKAEELKAERDGLQIWKAGLDSKGKQEVI
jgi:hypothetical protein